jgi:hypothetical protein
LLLFDVDLDTDLDLFLANGHVYPDRTAGNDKVSYQQPSHLYLNRGDGVFDLFVTDSGVFTDEMVARGVVLGDYDRDGDPDLLLTENGTSNSGQVHLWRNDIANKSFLRVQAIGTESNRNAIGTEITAFVNGLSMIQRVRTGSSYLSSSERTVTFGLGRNEKIDTLRIAWPSGEVVSFTDVAKNQEIRVVEGESDIQRVPLYE